MSRTTPELAPLPNFRATPQEDVLATHDLCSRPIHGGSSVESGFEPYLGPGSEPYHYTAASRSFRNAILSGVLYEEQDQQS
ncbi:hypothetical protein AVEN_144367-1 [Araneus ventricosus]|uniref:Uncharacterized protein n=1 Tax=Araneus ventricosus TaxID=182803 RepID=A0A4Y2XEA1_ARAVE|nr:hypothetical protein AVEN_144367-1 [Araneus ventricosus]